MKLFTVFPEISTRTVLTLTIFCSAIMVVDSIIVVLYVINPSTPTIAFNLSLFSSFVIFFLIINYIFLGYTKQYFASKTLAKDLVLKAISWIIIFNQFALSALLVFIIIQLLAFGSYNTRTLVTIAYMSHISSMGCLVFLSYKFLLWFKTNRNYTFLIYGCAFSLLVINIAISLAFLNLNFSYYHDVIKIRTMQQQIGDFSGATTNLIPFIKVYDYLSLLSFIAIWIPTVKLLNTYSKRLGATRYWALVIIPMLYFLFPFIAKELDLFEKVHVEYTIQFYLIYTIFISPYKQVGGILFGMVFLVTATKIRRENLRKLMFISAIGIALLFGSIVLHGMTYIVTPPFGIVTLSFMGLASYMLLTGLVVSSIELSKDLKIRLEIHQIAEGQLHLIKNLGRAEMERAIKKRCKPLIDKAISLESNNEEHTFEEEHYEEMITEVLNELKSKKKYR
jgi:hypothetical protein